MGRALNRVDIQDESLSPSAKEVRWAFVEEAGKDNWIIENPSAPEVDLAAERLMESYWKNPQAFREELKAL